MKSARTVMLFAAVAIVAANGAAAQSTEYRQGYADGFRDGYAKAQQELRQGLTNGQQAQAQAQVQPRDARIKVESAYYGETGTSKRCNATRHVRRAAEGQRDVGVDVNNEICGDPAPGKRKELTVIYFCGPVSKTESAYEHRKLTLSCR
jgi:hypothetical protein